VSAHEADERVVAAATNGDGAAPAQVRQTWEDGQRLLKTAA
jgi:hypothetical protein